MLTIRDQGRILIIDWSGDATQEEAEAFVKAYEAKLKKGQKFCVLCNCLEIDNHLKPKAREYMAQELKRISPLGRAYGVGSVVLAKSMGVRFAISAVSYFMSSDDPPLKSFDNHEDAFKWINSRFEELEANERKSQERLSKLGQK